MFDTPTKTVPDPDEREPVDYYVELKREDEVRAYKEWIDDYLGVALTPAQEEMLEAICSNQKTLIVGANGFGKTYFIAAFSLAYFYVNFPSVVMATSGTFQKMRRTYCEPVRKFHEENWGLPGKYLISKTRIRIDGYPESYWTASSPGDPGELEGVHSDYLLGVIEEADKRGITEDHFDSMSSLLTDRRDKLVATANPPRDEGDVVNRIMNDETWETVRFSSFDAHNVQVELDHPDPYQKDDDGEVIIEDGWPRLKREVEDEMVDGIVRLRQIKNDWESWNRESWPGIEEAMMSGDRDDLDVRWYRRRLGERPPELAVVHRPYTVGDIEDAFERAEAAEVTATPDGLGFDVARSGGDMNALVGVFGRQIRVLDYWDLGVDETHVDSEERVRKAIEPSWDCRLAIDAVGEGSGIADMIAEWYPNVTRFNNGSNAIQDEKYRDKWTESNAEFGKLIRDGAAFSHRRLREEAVTAARVLEFEVTYRRGRDADVLDLTNKKQVKDRLGRSPDLLDAAIMAAWAASGDTYSGPRSIPSSW